MQFCSNIHMHVYVHHCFKQKMWKLIFHYEVDKVVSPLAISF